MRSAARLSADGIYEPISVCAYRRAVYRVPVDGTIRHVRLNRGQEFAGYTVERPLRSGPEVARILRDLANNVEEHSAGGEGLRRDYNGARVGSWRLVAE